ncbi:MAG TPA: hypothetical protein VHA75_18940, partial [Rugosimonospora sp.]|nr:hypothetical protein [Rugosimonospora sp.]
MRRTADAFEYEIGEAVQAAITASGVELTPETRKGVVAAFWSAWNSGYSTGFGAGWLAAESRAETLREREVAA